MKSEFVDVNDTRKNLVVEIDSDVVDQEIDKVARDYGKAAKIPGFRPGKVPPKVVRQRFRDQILHDVAHGLIPRAVDEALRERGVEPVDTPDIRDVVVEEGQPLKFTATFDTVPAIDPGDYGTIQLRRSIPQVDDAAVDEAAKDTGEFDSLDALRVRVREDLEHEARHEAERELRADLMKQLAARVRFDVPQGLLDREIDRRVEEFVRRLMDQQIDPMKT